MIKILIHSNICPIKSVIGILAESQPLHQGTIFFKRVWPKMVAPVFHFIWMRGKGKEREDGGEDK